MKRMSRAAALAGILILAAAQLSGCVGPMKDLAGLGRRKIDSAREDSGGLSGLIGGLLGLDSKEKDSEGFLSEEGEDSGDSDGFHSGDGSEGSGGSVQVMSEEEFLWEYAKECLSEETDLTHYSEKNYMVPRVSDGWQGLFFGVNGMLEETEYEGILSEVVFDFDQDGHQELLILRMEPQTEPDIPCQATDLTASMYRLEGSEVIQADRIVLREGITIMQNAFRLDVFAKQTSDGTRLYAETDGTVFITADGQFWQLRAEEYRNGRFREVGSYNFEASAWEPSDVQACVDEARRCGLEVTELIETDRSILEQDRWTVPLASMERKVELTYDQYGSHEFQAGERMEFGYTQMRDETGGSRTVSLPAAPKVEEGVGAQTSSGTSVPSGQTGTSVPSSQTDTSVSPTQAAGEYILPNSSTELLTDAQIAAVPKDQRQMAINEIYARHGRRFNNPDIQQYFDSKSWYTGTIAPSSFKDSYLSEVERKNIEKLVAATR